MSRPDWLRVKSVFHAAKRLPRPRRESFVRRECVDDQGVLEEALRLVRIQTEIQTQSALHRGASCEANTVAAPPPPGGIDVGCVGTEIWSAERIESELPVTGDCVASRYDLQEELGSGGFGKVLAATDRIGGERVAIKFVALTSRHQMERYRRELATLRRSRLPGVVELLDDGDSGSWAYLVMRLVDGTWFPGDDVTKEDVGSILRRTHAFLEALARLHAAGVFHRDLKPSNVLVDADGRVTIVDLGIAEDETDPERWASNRPVVGTLPYMAPERRTGGRANPRTDVHAAGVMLLETLTDKELSVDAGAAARARNVRALAAALPEELPQAFRATLQSMVALDPNERPADVASVLEILEPHLSISRDLVLPRLGDASPLERVLTAAHERASIDVCGRRGAGKTRLLDDVARELEAQGCVVLRLTGRTDVEDPLASLAPDLLDNRSKSPTERDDALRERLRRWLRDGAVLLADDIDTLDPATRDELHALRSHGCVVRVRRDARSSDAVEVRYLTKSELGPLIRSSNRLFGVRDRAAALLWERTRGCPAYVIREIRSWCTAGLVTWNDGLDMEPSTIARLRAAGVVGIPSGIEDLPASLHPSVVDIWDVLSVAGTGLKPAAIAHVLDRAPRRIASALPELQSLGVVDVDAHGAAWVIARSPRLAGIDSERRTTWSRRIADELSPGSQEAFRHQVLAERHAEACRSALEVARAHVDGGRNADARVVLDAALAIARRHLPHDIALYDELVSRLSRVAISLSLVTAVELARYHVELAPTPTQSTRAWGDLLSAAAKSLQRDPRGALEVLDAMQYPPTDEHRRMRHVAANYSAQRLGDVAMMRARALDAARWARHSVDRENRALISSFAGWVRYAEGAYAGAAALHRRAARLTRSPRARVTALLNAASAAIEAGDLSASQESATEALGIAQGGSDPVNSARAERLLRVTAYRNGEPLDVDEELIAATARLSATALRGLTALAEAAIAWRAGRLSRAAELADRAATAYSGAPHTAAYLLMRSLAAVSRNCNDEALSAGFASDVSALKPIGVAAQAAALYADVAGLFALPPTVVERCLLWAESQRYPAMRREILSPDEVAQRLTSRTTEPHARDR